MAERETVEMRGDVPVWAGAVFEAVRRGRNLTKDALLAQILMDWAKQETHVATLIDRLTRGKAFDDQPLGD